MRVGSTFTGIGGADMGFEWAGMTIAWQCELDPWKRSVLAAHWPDVPIYEDITTMQDPEPVDVMVGGFPCQDLSVAGKRKGFTGERSVLAFEFLRIAEAIKPRWIVLENVPGLLSSNKGLDFQRLINEVVACGYGLGWRCLDSRYWGVPQRRRRIFIVARRTEAGIDSRAASGLALLALSESGFGDLTPCVKPGTQVAGSVGRGVDASRIGTNRSDGVSDTVTAKWHKGSGGPSGDECQNMISFYPTGGSQNGFWDTTGVSPTIKIGSGVGAANGMAIAYRKSSRVSTPGTAETWVNDGLANTLNSFDVGDIRTTHAVVDIASTLQKAGGDRGHRVDAEGAAGGHLIPVQNTVIGRADTSGPGGRGHGDANGPMFTLDRSGPHAVGGVFPLQDAREVEKHQNGTGIGSEGAPAYTLDRQQHPAVAQPERMTVRRLTPTECERLMSYPDGFTAPPGVKASDSKRYAACGDGIVSNVAYWIGQRIVKIDKETT
jgi:DNA (cytosine-5)-methyltransferase 1